MNVAPLCLLAVSLAGVALAAGEDRAAATARLSAQPREHARVVTQPEETYSVRVGGTLDGENTMDSRAVFGRNTMERPLFEPNVSLTMENVGDVDIVDPWIVINGQRDWFSIDALLSEVLTEGMTDEQKAHAIWRVFKESFYHYNAAEGAKVNGVIQSDLYDPIKMLNCYENNGCSTHAINLATLWQAAGLEVDVWNFAYTHWISQVRYDGGFHMLDADMRVFYPRESDGKPASIEECVADRDLIRKTHHYGDFSKAGADDDAAHGGWYLNANSGHAYRGDSGHAMGMTLRPGEKLVRRWEDGEKFHDNSRHVASLPKIANGQIVYTPPTEELALAGAEKTENVAATGEGIRQKRPERVGRIAYRVASPWVIVGGTLELPARVAAEFSFNGEHWWPLELTDGRVELDPYIATKNTDAKYGYSISVELRDGAVLDAMTLTTDVQISMASLPGLRLGVNEVEYRCASEGRLEITHEWRESDANRPPGAPTNGQHADGALTWEPGPDADGDAIVDHHVRVRGTPEMDVPLASELERATGSGEAAWPLPEARMRGGRAYYWQVRSRDAAGVWSDWSAVWSFETE